MRDPIDVDGVGKLHFVDDYDGLNYKVLILDDDAQMLTSVREHLLLRGIGQVDVASSTNEATRMLGDSAYDAVLADVWLYDPAGDDQRVCQGDEWLVRERSRLTDVFTVAVTGMPDRIGDRSALEAQGVDVVLKGSEDEEILYETLEKLALQKRARIEAKIAEIAPLIRRAIEQQEMADAGEVGLPTGSEADPIKIASDPRAKWKKVKQLAGPHDKGKGLEAFAGELFTLVPGLAVADQNRRVSGEEFDLVLANNVPGTFWMSLRSPFFFVECKNWREKVGVAELSKFWAKLLKHSNLTRFGIFFSASGFTKDCVTELHRYGSTDIVVVLTSGEDVEDLFESRVDVDEWLKNLILRALL